MRTLSGEVLKKGRLERFEAVRTLAAVMKRYLLGGILLLALNVFLTSCAHDEFAADTSSSAESSPPPVPGEKTGEGAGVEPGAGPGGASANVRW
jgi:hypothetical protein